MAQTQQHVVVSVMGGDTLCGPAPLELRMGPNHTLAMPEVERAMGAWFPFLVCRVEDGETCPHCGETVGAATHARGWLRMPFAPIANPDHIAGMDVVRESVL